MNKSNYRDDIQLLKLDKEEDERMSAGNEFQWAMVEGKNEFWNWEVLALRLFNWKSLEFLQL